MSQKNERRRQLYLENREKILTRNRAYREAHKAEIAAWMKNYHKAYYAEHKDAIKTAAKEYKIRTKYSVEHIKQRLLRFAKCRAKRQGILFNLSLDDFTIPKFCPVFKVELRPAEASSRNMDFTPTLDRIIPDLGYVKGNVKVISHRANTIKRDASLDELTRLVCYMRRVTRERGCA